jgi:hypothetical protein
LVAGVRPLNIEFGRALTGNKWDAWLLLVRRFMMVNLMVNPDVFVLKLNTSDAFTLKSMYYDLMNGYNVFYGNTFGN